jgi:putative membrane protein
MNQMQKLFASMICVSLLFACSGENKRDSNVAAEEQNEEKFDTRADEMEAKFVADAIEKKYDEMKLAELASAKSTNKMVQDVAQQVLNNQSESVVSFQNFARTKGITFPVEEGNESKKKVNELSQQQDADFDKKWCDEIVSKHEKAIRGFESMRDKATDPELKELITSDLKNLRAQLDELNALEKNITKK